MSRAARTARYTTIAYNCCRNRHCPKCQGAAAKQWLAEREAELLPVPYFHVVFTLPAAIADIAYQNKAVIYDILFKASAETLITIAADPKHLGARIGITSVLHTWGSALTHHPHVHMIVPGGGISLDGNALGVVPAGLLPPRARALAPVPPAVPGEADRRAPTASVLRQSPSPRRCTGVRDVSGAAAQSRMGRLLKASVRWARGSAGLSLALHPPRRHLQQPLDRVRPAAGVTFKWKDYRIKGRDRYKLMTLATDEFIRRFLIHVLPAGFHRIRHYGLFAKASCADNIARARELLAVPEPPSRRLPHATDDRRHPRILARAAAAA